ncbi:FAD-dependent oxidoreductase [Jannaschia sp. AI_61]|uniref:NAD(P)/FAD-dependent oxidoreductase n=1 Tax=Jannaschia sp. AI_61 TaxID=2829796 RepID=UPI0027E47012|nr:FAD-dependent oxidoreductase [Jannaschia sp. AI_61]
MTVLGAGIVGICTALSLAERGVPVRVIDRGPPGQATSFGNAGVISPWSIIPQAVPGIWRQIPGLMLGRYRPLAVRPAAWPRMVPWGLRFLRNATEQKLRQSCDAMQILCGPSIDLYRRHLAGTGHAGLVVDSCYVHAFRNSSRADLSALDYALRVEKGAACEVIDGPAVTRLEPALGSQFNAAIVIHNQARALSPGKLSEVLAEKATGLGVEFISDSITAVERATPGWRIVCDGETYHASQVVLALGAWSLDILRPLGIQVPLMAERGYHIECPTPGVTLTNSIMDMDAKVVASSMQDGVRVAGQAEFGDPSAPPSPRRKPHLERLAQAMMPQLNVADARLWVGARPSLPDSLPMLGPVADQPGLFLNFGHSHYGLMMAPKSGELLADTLVGRMPNVDLSTYAVDRFEVAS